MFNERENIGHALALLAESLERYASSYEIVVVDDASTDDSADLVRAAAARNPAIRLLRHERNLKLGAAIRTGFRAATKQVVLYTDADLPVDPDAIGRALRAMRVTGADVIAAYRFDRVPEGMRRAIYSLIYNTLITLLFRWPLRDINFAFKLFRREVLDSIELKSEGSFIDAEMIVKARNAGFRIHQIGVDYFPRTYGESHLSSPGVILRILIELVRLYPEMRRLGAVTQGRTVSAPHLSRTTTK
jgi:glycosyltransferase involved in cell wall biosynthesis